MSLKDLLDKEPMKKQYILKYMKEAIDSVLEKASFNVGRTPILHRVILDYLQIADGSVYKTIIEMLQDHLVHMLHTREGAKIAQLCILNGGPKDRKNIVKSFKGFVHAIAKEQYGHTVLLSCFECVDDTVMLNKIVMGELFKSQSDHSVDALLRDQYGSRVILYLLCGRDKKYQPQFVLQELETMDATRAQTTKKDDDIRRQQLLESVVEGLAEEIPKNLKTIIRDKNGSTVLIEYCKNIKSFKEIEKELINDLENTIGGSSVPAAPEEAVNVVKKMKLEADSEKLKSQGVDLTQSLLHNRSSTFAIKSMVMKSKSGEDCDWKKSFRKDLWKVILKNLDSVMQECCSNPKGTSGQSFILVALYENGDEELQKEMKKTLKSFKKKSELKISKEINGDSSQKSKKRKAESKSGIEILFDLI
jgi:pumilio family protein 6